MRNEEEERRGLSGLFTGRTGSNLSRTLKTMESYGLVRLEPEHGRKLAPKVVHDRVEEIGHEHARPSRYRPRCFVSARLDRRLQVAL